MQFASSFMTEFLKNITAFAEIKTIISLVALILTAIICLVAYIKRLQLQKSKILIEAAPKNKRAELIEQEIGKWGLSAKGLGADQQFELIKQLENQRGHRFYFTLILSSILLVLAGYLVWKSAATQPNKLRNVVLMDSSLKDVVYDVEDWKKGRTNADAITRILSDLPGISIIKETTSLQWEREEELIKFKPELIIIHASCFFDKTNAEVEERKFWKFLEYISKIETKLIIYSRGFHHGHEFWLSQLVKNIPKLHGKVDVLEVPVGLDFNDIAIRENLKTKAKQMLHL